MTDRRPRDSTRRFSDRVEYYDRWRPSYPPALLDVLANEGLLRPDDVVADLGAGTGKLTRLLLERGHQVLAVEPNAAMRAECERKLGHRPCFRAVDGRAEATTLGGASVDLVTVAQAFHWFDLDAFRDECRRVLRPGRGVAIVWNVRRVDETPFMSAYEAVLREHGTDYRQVAHHGLDSETLDRFFGAGRHRQRQLANRQSLDREGLRGRVLSASYAPAPGEPGHERMLADLDAVFETYAAEGRVHLEYDTLAYLGTVGPGPGGG